ncbi:MAG TPA: hypothetical protein VM555_04410 [Tahibacter sp.]|nr:hypothetical protein [Tahibacter sp.]
MKTLSSTTPPRKADMALRDVAQMFEAAGWEVIRESAAAASRADLRIRKAAYRYIVEIKATSEARPDRVVALLSQAILQARAYAQDQAGAKPMAVIWVADETASLFDKVFDFHKAYAPDTPIGLVSAGGTSRFVGPGLDELNHVPKALKEAPNRPRRAHNLFSDLNQWMLKVLLAPEIPANLLTAPRGDYRNATELADAANVSMMSAFRFVTRLKEERYLDESQTTLRVVRRADLFARWQAESARSTPEMPMCFSMPGNRQAVLDALLLRHPACLGLFAAADALGLGHVVGALPYVYVRRLGDAKAGIWSDLMPPTPTEQAHVIVKQASAPESLFRGAVVSEGRHVADVLQVWLDVYSHPSRGAEQAALLQSRVLRNVTGSTQ